MIICLVDPAASVIFPLVSPVVCVYFLRYFIRTVVEFFNIKFPCFA